MAHAQESTIGSRLARLRCRQNITQEQLAERAGLSVDTIRKLEQEQRQTAKLSTLTALAHALDVSVSEMRGDERGIIAGADDSEVLHVRLAVYGLSKYDGVEPLPTLEQLRTELAVLWGLYNHAGQYAGLARKLPEQIVLTRAVARDLPSAQQRDGQSVLAEVLQLTATLLTHLAYEDLGNFVLGDAIRAADMADDPLLYASQQATWTWILGRQGLHTQAEHVAVAAAEQIAPDMRRASLDELAVYGDLHCYAALAASRSGGPVDELARQMEIAAAAIQQDRMSRYHWSTFGPTVTRMYQVLMAVSQDQLDKALEIAGQVRFLSPVPAGVSSRYLLDVAWAQAQTWQTTEALDTLKRAEQLTPEAVMYHRLAKSTVEELLPRRRTNRLPGLVAMAERFGVTVG